MITVSSHEASGIRSGRSNTVNRLILGSGRSNEGAGLCVSINFSLPRVRQSLSKYRLSCWIACTALRDGHPPKTFSPADVAILGNFASIFSDEFEPRQIFGAKLP